MLGETELQFQATPSTFLTLVLEALCMQAEYKISKFECNTSQNYEESVSYLNFVIALQAARDDKGSQQDEQRWI